MQSRTVDMLQYARGLSLSLSIVVASALPVDSWRSPHAEFCNSGLLLGVISSRQPSEDILNCKLPAYPRHEVSMATVAGSYK